MDTDMLKMQIAGLIDHTYLKPGATVEKISSLCTEAENNGFFAVCIPPAFVATAKKQLQKSVVRVATVIGFPLGFNTPETKAFEARQAVMNGADEIDMVINVGMLQEGCLDYMKTEIDMVTESVAKDTIVKVIVETALLTEQQKTWAAKVILNTKAHFIKTSTGYASAGATVEDVRLFKYILGNNKQIKASGGIRTLDSALQLVQAGADRLGCSNSLEIIK